MSLMEWLDSRPSGPDLELDNFLQQYIAELQGSNVPASQYAAASLAPPWLASDNEPPINFDTRQSLAEELVAARDPLTSDTAQYAQSFPPEAQQEQQDDMLRSSSGSGATKCMDKPAAGSVKHTDAWTLKNRRAQKKIREKAKAGSTLAML